MNKRLTVIAHEKALEVLLQFPEPTSVDATIGNGHDTLFLAQHSSHVTGFDIQQSALDNTSSRLLSHNLSHKVSLLLDSHQNLLSHLQPNSTSVIMFNLGYLPGGDKNIITQSSSTIIALNASLEILHKSGLLSILLYPDHPGGQNEASDIHSWANSLNPSHFNSHLIQNFKGPELLLIYKL